MSLIAGWQIAGRRTDVPSRTGLVELLDRLRVQLEPGRLDQVVELFGAGGAGDGGRHARAGHQPGDCHPGRGGRIAGRHLIERGHPRIAWIMLPFGADLNTLLAGQVKTEMRAALANLALRARTHLDQAEALLGLIDTAALPALLPLAGAS